MTTPITKSYIPNPQPSSRVKSDTTAGGKLQPSNAGPTPAQK